MTASRGGTSFRLLRGGLAAAVALSVLSSPSLAGAHEFRPGLLDVTELGAGRYEVEWAPAPGEERASPTFPARCTHAAPDAPEPPPRGPGPAAGARSPGGPAPLRAVIDCGPAGLSGESIGVTGLAPSRHDVLVRLRFTGGGETTALLNAASPSFVVPSRGAPASAGLAAYVAAGTGHLLTGVDHVLFLLGLLLLVRGRGAAGLAGRWRALFLAVTAFTAAHSLTLALQALGAIQLPPAPVEAAIALSIVFVARECLRPPGAETLAARRPHVVTFGFGLLHGLGFAGGLSALHVPRGEVPLALLGFNLGVELGQLAIVAGALSLGAVAAWLIRRRLPRWAERSPAAWRAVPAYGIGAAAAFWLFQRIGAFWA